MVGDGGGDDRRAGNGKQRRGIWAIGKTDVILIVCLSLVVLVTAIFFFGVDVVDVPETSDSGSRR